MKRFLTGMVLSLVLWSSSMAWADGPDDQYVTIYNVIQQGDTFNEKGQSAAAMSKYAEAQAQLKRFAANYPEWNTKVVKYRLKYLNDKITTLSSQPPPAPMTNSPVSTMTNAPVISSIPADTNSVPAPEVTQPEPAKPTPPPAPSAEEQIKNLQEQIRGVEADKALLQAKLKEALSAQPASMDPQELARAQSQIKDLQKQNDLLQASLDQAKTNVPAAAPAVIPMGDENLKASLVEANKKVNLLNDENAKLSMANDALQAQVKKTAAPDANVAALQAENEVLKKQVADLQSKGMGPSSDDLARQLKESQAQVAVLQSDKAMLRLQKIALEDQVKKTASSPALVATVSTAATNASAAPVAAMPMIDSVTSDRIARLEGQRQALLKTVDAMTKDAYGKKKGKVMAARIDDLSIEVANLRSKMNALEASPVPYTAEETALMSQQPTTLMVSARSNVKKSFHELPASASVTLDQARRYFVAHDLEKAEEKYQEVLKMDEKNVAVLADLAAIELELGRTDDAEKHIKAALVAEPNDDYSLFVLGQIKFREKNYDEAFTALSQAAQLNPQNAKVQNFLGLTLSEKGMRGPAETAFRKAIQFDPGFAQAHLNLAVVYITQRPPLVELAKWHYQKALAAGQAPKADLEKMLDAGDAH